ncbi:MAG: [protein-PII] uridylyltransferase [Gammaproteobacteria bacterium 28-57-27]|nr:MAG: [protein-PII] uridylyltransferase [Gammaproteobacteria bacterium 28-57-27]
MPFPALTSLDPLTVKNALHDLREREFIQLRAGEHVAVLFAARTALIDALIAAQWADAGLDGAVACVLAVGGYGRSELFPYSDIDVLVLLANDAPPHLAKQIEVFISRLWDLGLHLGHSTRTVEECLTFAASDLCIMTSLLEGRFLSGQRELWQGVSTSLFMLGCEIWPAPAFFRGKQAEQGARHHRYDDSAYKIEPNIKESPGGLRDWHTLRWLSCRIFQHDAADHLVAEGLLTDSEHTALLERVEFLSRLRFALHLITERHEDRLLLMHQKTLAAMCSEVLPQVNESDSENQRVEAFMQRYFRAVLGIERINQLVMQQFEERLFPPRGEPQAINARFNRRGKLIETVDAQLFLRTPSAMLELFLLVQQQPEPLHIRASTLRQLQSHVLLLRAEMRHNPKARALFMEILRQPRGVFDALKQMNRLGVLAAYLPDFENIVGRMQFDLFHLYTVDAHTLLVIRNLRRFCTPFGQSENPLAHELIGHFDKPELLLLAALFHDIAKGMGGQHEVLGAEKARAFCVLHNLPADDTVLVEWLVRHHLHFSSVAQRRDLDDPQVIDEFTRWIGSRRKLDALYLLTVADIHATNPTLWSDWRAALLRDLYSKTRKSLEHGQHIIDTQSRRARVLERLAHACDVREEGGWHKARALLDSLHTRYIMRHPTDALVWRLCGMVKAQNMLWLGLREDNHRQVSELFIYTRDQPHLFAKIAATLDRLGFNIQSAYLTTTTQGMVVDDILFLNADGSPLRDAWMQNDLLRQLELAMTQDMTAARVMRRSSPLLQHFNCPTQIQMQTSEHGENTEVQLETLDRPGLLALIGGVLSELDMNLQGATINTLGEKAQDTLYVSVREPTTGKLSPLNPEQKQLLKDRLHLALRME